LINALQITNKTDKLINDSLSKIGLFSDIKSQSEIQLNIDKFDVINYPTEAELDPNTVSEDITNSDLEGIINSGKRKSKNSEYMGFMGLSSKDGILPSLKKGAIENIQEYKDNLIDRFNNIRGTLINEVLRQVREPFEMPPIYPDNVYNPDFRKLSLENFARNLGSDELNILQDLAGGLNNLLKI
jgi:hypothetical protein